MFPCQSAEIRARTICPKHSHGKTDRKHHCQLRQTCSQELKTIVKQGYAIDNEEFIENMVAIAVPVHDQHGRFIAALATHGPRIRLSVEDAIAKKDFLFAAAKKLTNILTDPNL